ncbi:MAG: hypothetical protein K6F52_01520 [Clostridia bacterium]|nr:hypothetical protein [Clostridia bacterium]
MENLYVFHGVDHKCGTTMIAQSVAEMLAESDRKKTVLLLSLAGRRNADFVRESTDPIDCYKSRIDSGLDVTKKLLRKNKCGENLYFISGVDNELEERYYLPQTAERLLEGLERDFDIIIADAGSEIDNGLAIGGLQMAKKKYLVMTQNESALRRYEKNWLLYESLKLNFSGYIINKYSDDSPYDISYLSRRMGVEKEMLHRINLAGSGLQAEMDCRTLLGYREEKYIQDVEKIADRIGSETGFEHLKNQRKGKWKISFI